jgi:cytochrome c oxidase subunit 3
MTTQARRIAPQFGSAAQQDEAATLGLWIFLATELLFFGPLFFGYLYGRTHFPAAFAIASRHTDVVLGTLNTAILLTSSLAMAIAVAAREAAENGSAARADEDRDDNARRDMPEDSAATRVAMAALAGTAGLGMAFLAVKGIEYAHEWQAHLFPGAGFAMTGPQGHGVQYLFFLYFAMTALHAVHLAIGIAAVAALAIALYRKKVRFASARHIRLAGLYWHFVDVVWIFLYPILYLVGRSGA